MSFDRYRFRENVVTKSRRKLTKQQKAERRRRRQEYMTIFVGGKMKRVKRPPAIDGMSVEEFIRRNADPPWLHQNKMWDEIAPNEKDV